MPVRFYVSWYPGDPIYPKYWADCAMLLSPTSFSRQWTVKQLSVLPSQLIIDSGGYRYHMSDDRQPSVADLLQRQLAILDGELIPTLVCALDVPVAPGTQATITMDRILASTLANAYELRRLLRRISVPSNVEFMAIVQGNDTATLRYCAHELKMMGFQRFGVGSLARLSDPVEVARRVATVFEIIKLPVHLFGIGSPQTLEHIDRAWVASVDSSRPAKAAACNELFYCQPFRRYGIWNTDGTSHPKLPADRCIMEALPCDCPICMSDSHEVMRIGRREHIRSRTVHNYFHLRASIEGISPG